MNNSYVTAVICFHLFLYSSNCPSCAADRELLKNFTREEIRDRILRKLGFAHAPNVSAADAVPVRLVRQLLSRYRHQLGGEGEGEKGQHGMQNDQVRFETTMV